jgi:hypothetical protein
MGNAGWYIYLIATLYGSFVNFKVLVSETRLHGQLWR